MAKSSVLPLAPPTAVGRRPTNLRPPQAVPAPHERINVSHKPPPLDQASIPPVSAQLVALALDLYDLGMASDGEPFALPKSGPQVARLFRGSGHSLRAALSAEYHDRQSKAPGNGALADALTVLEGLAQRKEPVPLPLRVARHEGELVLDIGDQTGRAVVVGVGGWKVVDRSPVLFRRNRLT